jgi:hypothetical protein
MIKGINNIVKENKPIEFRRCRRCSSNYIQWCCCWSSSMFMCLSLSRECVRLLFSKPWSSKTWMPPLCCAAASYITFVTYFPFSCSKSYSFSNCRKWTLLLFFIPCLSTTWWPISFSSSSYHPFVLFTPPKTLAHVPLIHTWQQLHSIIVARFVVHRATKFPESISEFHILATCHDPCSTWHDS